MVCAGVLIVSRNTMKKILLCERSMKGHRRVYLKWLSEIAGVDCFVFAPDNVGLDDDHFIKYEPAEGNALSEYLKWAANIKKIVADKGINVVHITDGDSIMKFFGLGFGSFGAAKRVITYHHFFSGAARRLSYLAMNRGRSVSVGHTETVCDQLRAVGVEDVRLCRYPSFTFESVAGRNSTESRRYFGLPENIPVIGIIGGGNYKNIIPFLETMQNCREPFHIHICVKNNEDFALEVENAVARYADRVTIRKGYLSDDEYELFLAASDIVYCLYDHSFDGASGPLTDGVCAQKLILSCAHGSLGQIVSENHLGFTAECTDANEMLEQTTKALRFGSSFEYDEVAGAYRRSLMPDFFQENYRKLYEE